MNHPEGWRRIKNCIACREIDHRRAEMREPRLHDKAHDICSQPYWRSRKELKCPKCKAEWDGKHFVGPKAVTSTEAYQRAQGVRAKRSIPTNSGQGDEEEEEDEDA